MIINNEARDRFYHVYYEVINARNYGVPQNRKRLVLIAARDFVPERPEATHGEGLFPYMTVREAINRFPAIDAGGSNAAYFNHRASSLSGLNLRRIAATPHDGGSRLDWPHELILTCHNNSSEYSKHILL